MFANLCSTRMEQKCDCINPIFSSASISQIAIWQQDFRFEMMYGKWKIFSSSDITHCQYDSAQCFRFLKLLGKWSRLFLIQYHLVLRSYCDISLRVISRIPLKAKIHWSSTNVSFLSQGAIKTEIAHSQGGCKSFL